MTFALRSRRVHLIFMLATCSSVLTLSFTSKVHAACGDAVVELGEDCDDGNNFNCDACTNDCKRDLIYSWSKSQVETSHSAITVIGLHAERLTLQSVILRSDVAR